MHIIYTYIYILTEYKNCHSTSSSLSHWSTRADGRKSTNHAGQSPCYSGLWCRGHTVLVTHARAISVKYTRRRLELTRMYYITMTKGRHVRPHHNGLPLSLPPPPSPLPPPSRCQVLKHFAVILPRLNETTSGSWLNQPKSEDSEAEKRKKKRNLFVNGKESFSWSREEPTQNNDNNLWYAREMQTFKLKGKPFETLRYSLERYLVLFLKVEFSKNRLKIHIDPTCLDISLKSKNFVRKI